MLALARMAAAMVSRFRRLRPGVALPILTGAGGTLAIQDIFAGDGGGDGRPRRRRRKRVLTSNDRADISFITATLGAPAGKSFAMIVAARA